MLRDWWGWTFERHRFRGIVGGLKEGVQPEPVARRQSRLCNACLESQLLLPEAG